MTTSATATQQKLNELFSVVKESHGPYTGKFQEEPSAYFDIARHTEGNPPAIIFSIYTWLLSNCEYDAALTERAQRHLQSELLAYEGECALLNLSAYFLQPKLGDEFDPADGGDSFIPKTIGNNYAPEVEPSVGFDYVSFYHFDEKSQENIEYMAIQLQCDKINTSPVYGSFAIFRISDTFWSELMAVEVTEKETNRILWTNYDSSDLEIYEPTEWHQTPQEYGYCTFSVRDNRMFCDYLQTHLDVNAWQAY